MIAIIVTSLGDHYSYGSLTLRQSERARDREARGIEGAEDWEGLDTRVPELRDRPVSTQHERFMTSSSEEEPNLPSGRGLFVNDITRRRRLRFRYLKRNRKKIAAVAEIRKQSGTGR